MKEEKIYSGTSLQECLVQISKEYNISIESINYKLMDKNVEDEGKTSIIFYPETLGNENKNGSIKIESGEIYIKNPINGGKAAAILINKSIQVYIDGKIVKGKVEVFEDNSIEVVFEKSEGKRNINVTCSRDLMSAFLDISYEPQVKYGLKDSEEKSVVYLEPIEIEKKDPPLLKKEEIEKILLDAGVMYGIDKEAIMKATSSRRVENLLIAKGKPCKDYENDRIELKFDQNQNQYKEDLRGNIDYKSIGHVRTVKKGELLGIIVKGKPGVDGVNVKGKIIRAKKGKQLKVMCADGCEQIGNIIKSTIEGKAQYKAGKFAVSSLYEVKSNVDLSTGNIKFNGDVVVFGNVLEGMKVEGVRGVEIYKSIAKTEIKSNGNIKIGGNVILSTVSTGGENTFNIRVKEMLEEISQRLNQLIKDCYQLDNENVIGRKTRPGEIVKVLIEKKYKDLPILLRKFEQVYVSSPDYNENLLSEIKLNLLGFGPLNIQKYSKLEQLNNMILEENTMMSMLEIQESDIYITYCQDSVISATGNVYVTGKGSYISNISSNKGIYFKGIKSVLRGGVVKAKEIIECNFIGSEAGVKTEIIVDYHGEIFAKFAYHNTKFVVGNLEYTLDVPCKEIHVYRDKLGELQVDKFKA